MPETNPVVVMVATAVLLLVHVPPGVASDKRVVYPWHTLVIPVIGASGFTVTVTEEIQPPAVV
jgi:hypothetical protein